MIPTSIDGTDITGATIDGTDVQEITVDGQIVFSAGPSNLPVAYSNLVAWYPFDSATYGGSNADDVTAIIGGSGDDTAYDGTVSGATYQSSGGVTDINAGANSGAFDFDGSNDTMQTSGGSFAPDTITFWLNPDFDINSSGLRVPIAGTGTVFETMWFGNVTSQFSGETISITDGNGGRKHWNDAFSSNQWLHFAIRFDSDWDLFVDGSILTPAGTTNGVPGAWTSNTWDIGFESLNNRGHVDGTFDDVRFYDRPLTDTEIGDIVSNTPHP